MFWRNSFNFQKSLSTTINLVHTLKKSLCGFWANNFVVFGRNSFNFQRSLSTHVHETGSYSKEVTLKILINHFLKNHSQIHWFCHCCVWENGTGCGRLWYWTILRWEILLLDFFAVGDCGTGLFCCGRFYCWTFLLWEIVVLDYFASGQMNRQASQSPWSTKLLKSVARIFFTKSGSFIIKTGFWYM